MRRKPPQEPGRLVRKKYKFKLSKLARNALTIIIILIFVLSGMGVAALMGAFS